MSHLFVNLLEKFVTSAARHAIPAIYSQRDYVVAGGLMNYGPDLAHRLAGGGIDQKRTYH